MLGAEVIASTLKSPGVDRVFVFPAGPVAPLLDALAKAGISYFCPRKEQGAKRIPCVMAEKIANGRMVQGQ